MIDITLVLKKTYALWLLLIGILSLSLTVKAQNSVEFKVDFISGPMPVTEVKKENLPKPYDFLLTEPLMTLGLEKFYQQSTSIEKINSSFVVKGRIYKRAIKMLLADKRVVEVAFIAINTEALPKLFIHTLQKSNIPFGKLLSLENIKVHSIQQHYFTVSCNTELASYFDCATHSFLFGRTNILVAADSGQWIAKVTEVLV